ncbi:hypothetical protein P692DRAFT_20883761 [Suillus brevipes Sb2]|nr:hypothetical protein P692DRAFT_20883761 [Suillus brevipes Sb2]
MFSNYIYTSPPDVPIHAPSLLISDFPGATTPHAPHTSHQACLNQHSEAGLATGSASSALPQAPNLSLGRKHVAEDLEDRDTKRIKMESGRISLSPEMYVSPLLNKRVSSLL